MGHSLKVTHMNKYISRSILTVIIVTAWSFLRVLLHTATDQAIAVTAIGQLSNSNAAQFEFLSVQWFQQSGVGSGILGGIAIAALYFVWRGVGAVKPPIIAAALAVVATVAIAPNDAYAYYDKTDRAEWIEIGANQSAFMIAMTGANKTNQAKFGSVAYLEENKVAAKRVQIPHVKADNTGMMTDYYVSSHRVFILDRTPYTRDWSNAVDKGTSSKKEGFRFESADSFPIETAITASALVTEEDAAKFFYWFGSANQQLNGSPDSVFASVAHGRSLAEVMDTVVRSRIQVLLAREFGKRKLIDGMQSKATIMDIVEATVKKEFAAQGVTITSIGFSSDLTYDDKIQTALDSAFIAQMKLANKDAYNISLDLDRRDAENSVIRAQGETMKKWNGSINMPSFMVMSEGFMKWIGGFFGGPVPDTAKK